MPFNYTNVGGAWKTITKIYQNVSGSWKNVTEGYVNVSGAWKKFWPSVQTPFPSGNIVIRDWNDTNIVDNDQYLANTGDTLFGRRGPTWQNNPTAFQYRWRYSDYSGGPYVDFSPAETTTTHPSQLNTASPISRINAWNDRWIVYQVRAQNSFGFSDWFTSINEAHLVKYPPVNNSLSITGTPAPGMTLTAVSNWQNTFINTNDQSPASYEYDWYDNDTNESIYFSTTNTFIPSPSDLNRNVRVKITATNTGGSTTAVSAAVGPIVTVLAVDLPYMSTDSDGYILDNRGGIINGVTAKVTTTVYGVTSGTSYRVRYRYKSISSGSTVYYLNGAVSTEANSWETYTSNGAGVGGISSVVVDSVNQVTELYDLHYIDETYYNGSTYGISNLATWLIDIEVSAVKSGTARVIRTLTYGISAAPVPTIIATPSTVATNTDVVFSGTIGGLNGRPAYPVEYFIDFGDGNIDYNSFAAGARNPTYSMSHQYEAIGSYTAEISTNPEYTTATTSVTAILAPGAFDIISVVKGLSNGSTRPVTVTWEQSANADRYEVQLQRQYSDLSGWVTIQTFDASPYINEPTRTATINASQVAKFYRVSVRARKGFDLGTAAYSGGGTLASPAYVEAAGIAPGAPTSLSASSITTTTATISFTTPASVGSAVISTYEWSKDNVNWNNSFSTTSPINVLGLTGGTFTTIYVRAINGDDAVGPAGFVSFTTSTAPGAFNITSATKGLFSSSLTRSTGSGNGTGTGARPIVISWQQSANADRYEVQIEGRDYDPVVNSGASQTWLVFRTLNEAPYVNEPTRTETFNAIFYWQYRVTARARSGTDLATAAYSNGGTSSSYVYYEATGTAPSSPTIGTITPAITSASVAYTNPASVGSASIAYSQWSTDNSTWTQTFSSPFTISSLTGGSNYTVYMRAYNNDGLVSPTVTKAFTTNVAKPPKTPTSPTTSGVTTTNITFSWTAPTADSTNNAATGYEHFTSTTNTAPTGAGTATTSTSVNFTYTASTTPVARYFWVRATNADGNSAWTSSVTATPTAASTFVTPAWNGTMPTWAATDANGSNFQRINSPTASRALRYGWNNGTFSFSGSIRGTEAADRGWDFFVSGTQPATTTTVRTPTHNRPFNTTALSPADPVFSTDFLYRVSPAWNINSRFGSIRPYQFGTDNQKYVRGAQPNGTWSASI